MDNNNFSDKKQTFEKIKKYISKRFQIIFLLSCIFTITGFFGKHNMMFELISHFRVQYFCIFVLGLFFWSFKKKIILFTISFVFFITNASLIAPWYINNSKKQNATNVKNTRILLSNVHTKNRNYQQLLSLIKKEKPNIIVIQELNYEWADVLKHLNNEYRYKKLCPRAAPDGFGVAIISNLPVKKFEVHKFGNAGVPSIIMNIQNNQLEYNIIATHPLPPSGPHYFKLRNDQLDDIANHILKSKLPCIVIGDLNLTMWSHYYKLFISKTNFNDARKGFGIKPTWPTIIPPFFLPIDHLLHSHEFEILNFRLGTSIGSDHLPVIADYYIKSN